MTSKISLGIKELRINFIGNLSSRLKFLMKCHFNWDSCSRLIVKSRYGTWALREIYRLSRDFLQSFTLCSSWSRLRLATDHRIQIWMWKQWKGLAEMCQRPSSMNLARTRSSRGRMVTHRMTEVKGWLETCHFYTLNSFHLFESRGMIRKKSV